MKRGGPIKRKRRLRAKSLNNSRKHEDLKLRREYMEANPWCELAGLLPMTGWNKSVFINGRRDPHHIVSGKIGGTPRWDLVTNLAAVCRPVHEWCESFSADGVVLGLWLKHTKQELDLPKLDEITHVSVMGWVENAVLHFEFVEEIRRKLLSALLP